ncbi:MAG: SMC-Scp complex subunit ScpB [Mesoaciditoga sp.]|uniref:SMC-Scp complex subunit ScpB n=1 Tax=Athalassotoga sp. TaxID=2022597 RepID=UPI000CA9E06F|nr:MAG: SMC-Scp complex subunit ScpB [Mesoaciditoga sp.]HEU23978.1 SMC-Scp complex subunit ScpB [Mesoaciditoga lauensis]
MKNTMAEIEALIMSGRGLTVQELIRLTGKTRNEVLESIDKIEEEYSKEIHGVELKNVAGKYSFFTKADYAESISKIKKRSVSELTNSQMQVLAIIAYNQPLTLKEIERFRGSSCANQTKELISLGLVRRIRDRSKKGNPFTYVTTDNFLKILGISDISKLKEDLLEDTKVPQDVRNNIEEEG